MAHPFRPLVAITIVLTSAAITFIGLHYKAMVAQETKNILAEQQMDKTLKELQQRIAAEKAVREKLQAEAKNASDEALRIGVVPKPNPVASSAGGPHTDPSKLDVVVNKKRPVNPIAYAPNVTTTSCDGYGSATVSPLVVEDFVALCQAAAAAGVPLGVSSSYRSYSTQISTYNYWVGLSGTDGADTYSARPGYSEHQTGFAIDFRVPGGASLNEFSGTAQQLWLARNAATYGFIQRYTEENTAITGYRAETWHYRYLGRTAAATYVASGKDSLETLWSIPGGLY